MFEWCKKASTSSIWVPELLREWLILKFKIGHGFNIAQWWLKKNKDNFLEMDPTEFGEFLSFIDINLYNLVFKNSLGRMGQRTSRMANWIESPSITSLMIDKEKYILTPYLSQENHWRALRAWYLTLWWYLNKGKGMFSCLANITSGLGEYQMRPIYHQTELGYLKVTKETQHQTEM